MNTYFGLSTPLRKRQITGGWSILLASTALCFLTGAGLSLLGISENIATIVATGVTVLFAGTAHYRFHVSHMKALLDSNAFLRKRISIMVSTMQLRLPGLNALIREGEDLRAGFLEVLESAERRGDTDLVEACKAYIANIESYLPELVETRARLTDYLAKKGVARPSNAKEAASVTEADSRIAADLVMQSREQLEEFSGVMSKLVALLNPHSR